MIGTTQTTYGRSRREREIFDRLKAILTRDFAAPESSYVLLTADDVMARNRDGADRS